MGLSLGGGIGPLRASVRLGGRGRSSKSDGVGEAIVILVIGSLVVAFGGAWFTFEALSGRWGVGGRIIGVVCVALTLAGVSYNPKLGTLLLTPWVYLAIIKVRFPLLVAEMVVAGLNSTVPFVNVQWRENEPFVFWVLMGILVLFAASVAITLLVGPLFLLHHLMIRYHNWLALRATDEATSENEARGPSD